MGRSVEGWFHECWNGVPSFLLQSRWRSKGLCHGDDFCVVARRKQLQTLGKILEKRFEVKQTRHIGLSASNAKVLKILNRAIKIDVLNDEMTLEADTKLVDDALETMKLIGAKGVDSPRVWKNAEQTIQIKSSKEVHISGVDFVPQLDDEVGVCCSRQNGHH